MEVGFLGLDIMGKAMAVNPLHNGFEVTVWNRTLSKVVFDKDGVLDQICGGKGYFDMSTVDADTSSKINEAITKKGGRFLEAPVSGSKKPAEDGQLIILAAREKKSFLLGAVGNGAKMKLLVNMIMGREETDDLSANANPMFQMKGPEMIKSSYPPAFPLKHQQKDMRLAPALGDENAVSMPIAAAANEQSTRQ